MKSRGRRRFFPAVLARTLLARRIADPLGLSVLSGHLSPLFPQRDQGKPFIIAPSQPKSA